MTKLIFGLGNPPKKYQETRHNLGQKVIKRLHQSWQEKYSFPEFQLHKDAFISSAKIEREKIILGYSNIWINQSGRAIKQIVEDFKVKIKDVWLIYDDIDLPLGKIRIRGKGSSSGHRGVESVISFLATEDFPRFRIGIETREKKEGTFDFVLGRFSQKEKGQIQEIIKKTISAIEFALKNSLEKAMSVYN